MLHGILEQYEVHDGIYIIVLTKGEVKHLGEGIDVGELIVKFLIESSNEVSEDERLRSSTEVLLQVELGEGLGRDISGKLTIFSQVRIADKSISINSLGLVHPQSDELIRLFNSFRFGIKDSLEDVSQVTNIEFIMEVLCSLSELLSGGNIRVELQGSLDHKWYLFKNGGLESAEMLSQVSGVDGGKGSILGHTNGKEPEMSLESWVDCEGTGLRVHGCN